jgi:hypothetical protein
MVNKIRCICKKCKVIFYKYESRIKDGRGIYCSKKCQFEARKGRPNIKIKGINNGMWKKEGISYKSLHRWVRNNKPRPVLCEECNILLSYEVANISGEYKRDINDFDWLCRSCHKKRHNKLLHPKIKQICLYCKKEQIVNASYRNKYCSKECANKSQRTGSYWNCVGCDKLFYVINYHKETRKYCSRVCYFKSRRNIR